MTNQLTTLERQMLNRLCHVGPITLEVALEMVRTGSHAPKRTRVYFANYEQSPPRYQQRERRVEYSWEEKRDRRVIVGVDWIRQNMPTCFAQIAAARFTGARLPACATEDTW